MFSINLLNAPTHPSILKMKVQINEEYTNRTDQGRHRGRRTAYAVGCGRDVADAKANAAYQHLS